MKRLIQAVMAALVLFSFFAVPAYAKADKCVTHTLVAATPTNFDFVGRMKIVELISEDTGGTFAVWYYKDGAYELYSPDGTEAGEDSVYPFFAGIAWSRDLGSGGFFTRGTLTRVVVTATDAGDVTVIAR